MKVIREEINLEQKSRSVGRNLFERKMRYCGKKKSTRAEEGQE